MKNSETDIIVKNSVFGWIALGALLVLMIPFVAMQFTDEVNWEMNDFVIMGVLIFGVSSLFVLAARHVPKKNRLVIGAMFLFAFLWLWAELAVGVFTNWGS